MGNLRDRGVDSGGLVQLLLESGRSGNLRSATRGGLDRVLSRRRGELGLLGTDWLRLVVDLLAGRSLATEEILDLSTVVAGVLLADVGNLLHLL